MAEAKFKKYFNEMFETHREEMMKFMVTNQEYSQDKRKHKPLFDKEGEEIQSIVETWMGKLCHQMESGKNGAYSNKLADKFMGEVTKYFPYYHDIGIKIK